MRTLLGTLAALALGLVVTAPLSAALFTDSQRELSIGPHQASVRPAFDGNATLDFGPLLPRVRIPVDAPGPLGVDIRLGQAEVTSLEELVQQDAVIASQPQGEIAAVREVVVDMGRVAVLQGAGVGVLVAVSAAVAWRSVGPVRRRRLLHDAMHPARPQLVRGGVVIVAIATGVALVVVPQHDEQLPEPQWTAARDVFPELPANGVLDSLEISDGSITRGSRALVEGALYLYEDSVSFYGELAEQARETQVRTPGEDERTALVVTDRHDNIGMDPVARIIADQAEAEVLINLGDDTSQGDSWERFSINSLADEFDGFERVAVAGNHDSRTTVEQLRSADFTVLEGEPVEVAGIRFLGDHDPRGTTLTGYTGSADQRDDDLAVQDEALTGVACEADEADERVGVLAVHSWASGKQVAASGCVDLVLTGHLHYQVGPTAIDGPEGTTTTRLTTASTGGAVLPFALGSSLRREAQVTLVTFDEDGGPVGLQPVSFMPSGQIDVADYVPLPLAGQDDEPDEDTDGTDGGEDLEEDLP
ncbi:metallophosphoesterase [Aeromicrobium sp. CF4.19]|uniref:metallophosphoesterase family protein n=1 Tax=Aeromicrobium sp. CF4.19 TaxID=3373082 RepID=UPI003EE61ECF